jgi:hypothetical protein
MNSTNPTRYRRRKGMSLSSVSSRFLAFVKKVWANRTVERATWSLAELGVGWLIANYSGSVVAGVSAGFVLLFVKEFIIAQLAAISS